ncbi:hypothetical protein ACQPZX_43155 [Actinoplanes sp. CA-142083]|uniref:hypothetical protein n=1 Tax=Actinoplanes sp. CA-142083 TaxID=3239903 RepID=UPI003D8EFD60
MNLLKSKFQRTTSVVAGTLLGLVGVAVLAGPASAHNPAVYGEPTCADNGSYKVDWTVDNPYKLDAEVKKVVLDGKTVADGVGDIKVGKWVKGNSSLKLTGSSVETGYRATLTVYLEYTDHQKYQPTGKTYRPKNCPSTPPTTQPTTTPPTTTPTTQPTTTAPTTEPTTTAPTTEPTPTETTPEVPVPTPSTTGQPGEAQPILEEDCTTITIGLDNPADGVDYKLHYKTSKGEVRDLVVKPGEKKSEKFSATEGFSIELTVTASWQGETASETVTIDYEKPDNCSGGSGGGLPVTGAAAGGIAGGAAALLAIGAVLFVLARRRKVRFTA